MENFCLRVSTLDASEQITGKCPGNVVDQCLYPLYAELERRLISRALQITDGNRTKAAELLDLSYRALLYKIRDYGLD